MTLRQWIWLYLMCGQGERRGVRGEVRKSKESDNNVNVYEASKANTLENELIYQLIHLLSHVLCPCFEGCKNPVVPSFGHGQAQKTVDVSRMKGTRCGRARPGSAHQLPDKERNNSDNRSCKQSSNKRIMESHPAKCNCAKTITKIHGTSPKPTMPIP